MENDKKDHSVTKAILTDIQFWIPVVVLVLGIVILFYVSTGAK